MGSFHFDLPSTFSGHFGKNRIGEGGWARAEAKFIRWCGSDCGCWGSGGPFSLFLECEGLERGHYLSQSALQFLPQVRHLK